jgi:endonuclease/exonuclease/phosphatase (EEP) superfamily protein YafD
MNPLLILIAACILSLAGYFGKFSFWFDLTAHFQVQYLFVFVYCALIYGLKKKWKMALLALCLTSLNLARIIPLYTNPNPSPQASQSQRLKILLVNVHTQNTQYKTAADYIRQIKPDILALEEINEAWVNGLQSVLKEYPYYKEDMRNDNFGIGLYSRIPLENIFIEYWGQVEVPSIAATIHLDSRPVTLLFTHPVPPVSQQYFQWRNNQLETIASKRGQWADDLILIGDLNTSSWSYYFKKFVKDLGVRDSRLGFGLQPSWPARLPLLWTTIDHCLVSADLVVFNRRTGQHIGSDHYPVYLEIGITGKPR